jgi:tellurite resistance protein
VNLFGRLSDNIHALSARLHSRVVLESAMAAAALVATADGEVTFAKRAIRDKVLASLDSFKTFEVHVAVDLFEGFAAEIRKQGEIGKDRALRCVSEVAGDREAAQLVMRIARAIGQVGEGFSVRESPFQSGAARRPTSSSWETRRAGQGNRPPPCTWRSRYSRAGTRSAP